MHRHQGWGCSLTDKTAFTKFCGAVKYKLNCCDIPNKPNYPSRPCKWWLEFSKGLAGGTAPLPLVQGMHCEPCGAGGGLGAFPLHCASETVSLLPALLCRGTGLSCNLPATTAKAGSKGGGEDSSVQSHLGRTMGHEPSMPPSAALVTCPFHGPPFLFVQCPGCAPRKECSSGMVTALCPQACLPDLGGKGHSFDPHHSRGDLLMPLTP